MFLTPLRAAVAAAALLVAAPAAAQQIVFTLNNETGVDLVEFYVSPVSEESWEEDLLGADIMPAGQSAEVTIGGDRGCDYDLKFVFADGDELIDEAINLCEVGTYDLTTE